MAMDFPHPKAALCFMDSTILGGLKV
jgi:hypothetical protein